MKTLRTYFHIICIAAIAGFILSMVAGLYKVIVAVAALLLVLAVIARLTRRR